MLRKTKIETESKDKWSEEGKEGGGKEVGAWSMQRWRPSTGRKLQPELVIPHYEEKVKRIKEKI